MLLMLQKLHNKNKNSFMYTICYSFSNTLYWNLTEIKKETKKSFNIVTQWTVSYNLLQTNMQ